MLPSHRIPLAAVLLGILVVGPVAGRCDEPPVPPAPAPAAPPAPTTPVPVADPFVMGRFELATLPVIDGDTLRLADGTSVRVRGLDAEETFKNARHRVAAANDFAAYAREMRGDSSRPVKYGTPMGEEATSVMRTWFEGVTHVRLERDALADRDEDAFGRRLAHVVVLHPGGEFLLAERAVRLGLAPYFVKYGRSVRFDARFRAAQAAAQAEALGVWAPEGTPHYPDYPERLAWWEERAAQVDRWRQVRGEPGHVTLGAVDADERLAALVGQEAVVFGSLERLLESDEGPRKILFLAHRRLRGFPVVVFDPTVWSQFDIGRIGSMFLTVRGVVTLYRDRPQIVVTDPAQLRSD